MKQVCMHGKLRSILNVALGLLLTIGVGIGNPMPVMAAEPAIISPNGGESWTIGTAHDITWSSVPAATLIDVGFGAADLDSPGNNTGRTLIDTNNPANDSGTLNTVEIWAYSDMTGVKVAAFYIVSEGVLASRGSPAVIPSVPTGQNTFTGLSIPIEAGDYIGLYTESGEVEMNMTGATNAWWQNGDQTGTSGTDFIYYASKQVGIGGYSIVNNVNVELSRDNGGNWESLFDNTANDGTESWSVDGAATAQALIRLTSVADSSVIDVSDANFSITDPTPPSSVHIASINMKWSYVFYNSSYIYATATARVVDQNGVAVRGARVYGRWSGSTSDTDNGLTGYTGIVSLKSNNVVKSSWIPRRFTFTVTSIVIDGYSYDAAANVVSSNSIYVR